MPHYARASTDSLMVAMGNSMANRTDDLDRWSERGLITMDQRAAILEFERERARDPFDSAQDDLQGGPGRLANAISTVGAAIAILAVFGLFAILADDWTDGQLAVAAVAGAAIMIAAGWVLVRNGWGAPAGLCAICGLVLIPVAFIAGSDAAGWWPDEDFNNFERVEREQQRIVGIVLLLSILPGMATTLLRLRQAWAGLPVALWYGGTLIFFEPFDVAAFGIAQTFFGAVIAAAATFVWGANEGTRGSAWWLQIGGLLLAANGVVFTSFDNGNGVAAVVALLAIGIFVVGVVLNRTAWMVAGAVAAVVPVLRLTLDIFEGAAALLAVALVGMAIAFLPLVLLKRRTTASP